jgi:Ca2+-binding EF-hand superfamily protein
LQDLREARRAIKEHRAEVLQLRAENARLEHGMREQERRIMRLGDGAATQGPTGQAALEQARLAAEKSTLVRQLKSQILNLRDECSQKDIELKNLQRKTKSSHLTELAAQREEYYYETVRLRNVVVSLRQDMAAELMYRNNLRHSSGASANVEQNLRQEISRLAAGFQDILLELTGKDLVSSNAAVSAAAKASGVATDPLRPFSLDEPPAASFDELEQRGQGFLRVNTVTRTSLSSAGNGLGTVEGDELAGLEEDPLYRGDAFDGDLYMPQWDSAGRSLRERGGAPSPEERGQPRPQPTAAPRRHASVEAEERETGEEERKTAPPVPEQKPAPEPAAATAAEAAAAEAAAEDEDEEEKKAEDGYPQDHDHEPDAVSFEIPSPSGGKSPKKMDDKMRLLLMQQMRDTFRRLLSSGSFDINDLFNHLDDDGDGELTAPEIFEGLSAVPGFEAVTEQQVEALVKTLDNQEPPKGWVSMDEFKAFVASESKKGKGPSSLLSGAVLAGSSKRPRVGRGGGKGKREKKKKPAATSKGPAVLPPNASPADFAKGVIETFKKTVEDGFSLDELFAEMDADGDGQIQPEELQAILVRFRFFKNVTVTQVTSLLDSIHAGQLGDVSIEEFKLWLDAEEKAAAALTLQMALRRSFPTRFRFVLRTPSSPPTPLASKELTGHPDADFVRNARLAFRSMVRSGESVETLFSRMDVNNDGSLSVEEVQEELTKHPSFRTLTKDDVLKLINLIDGDQNGTVEVTEFRAFVLNEKRQAAASALQAQLRRRHAQRQVAQNKSAKVRNLRRASTGQLKYTPGEKTSTTSTTTTTAASFEASISPPSVGDLEEPSTAYSDDFET